MNFTAQNVTPIGRTAKWVTSLMTSYYIIAFSAFYPCVLMCVLRRSVASDSVTLWMITRQVPLAMEFSRQEHRSGLPSPTVEDLPDPGVEHVSYTSCISWQMIYHCAPWEALCSSNSDLIKDKSVCGYLINTNLMKEILLRVSIIKGLMNIGKSSKSRKQLSDSENVPYEKMLTVILSHLFHSSHECHICSGYCFSFLLFFFLG